MQVQPTTRGIYRQAAQVLARAFLDEPVSQRVYRGLNVPQQLQNLTADFTGELAVCLRRGEPLHICRDGIIAAAAVIYPPGAYPLSRLDQLQVWLTSLWGHTRYDVKSWEDWLEETGKLHPQQPHYYLEYIGVEPDCQGQGYGSLLLVEMLHRADRLRVGCYLETATPRNLPLYQRHGFEIMAEKEIIGLPAWLMWRSERRSAEQGGTPE